MMQEDRIIVLKMIDCASQLYGSPVYRYGRAINLDRLIVWLNQIPNTGSKAHAHREIRMLLCTSDKAEETLILGSINAVSSIENAGFAGQLR